MFDKFIRSNLCSSALRTLTALLSSTFNISALDLAPVSLVFTKLYNAIPPTGMGFAKYNPIPLEEDLAPQVFEREGKVLTNGAISFKWVIGKLMPCRFQGDLLYVAAYNYENGEGLAQQIVASCKNVNEKEIAPQKVKRD